MNFQDLAKHYSKTRELFIWQDSIFAGKKPTRDDLAKWKPLVMAHSALCGPNNLSVRQKLIEAYVYQSQITANSALIELCALMRNGLWLENPSYALYVQRAVDWYTDKVWNIPWDSTPMFEAYKSLVGPDGRLPLGETADEDFGIPTTLPHLVDSLSFYCKRWFDEERKVKLYVLIGLDTDTEPRNELHYHPHGGMVAVWSPEGSISGKIPQFVDVTLPNGLLDRVSVRDNDPFGLWKSRPTPYTGFNFLESFESRCLRPVLPDGALRPLWRVKPPKITGIRHGSTFRFEWDYGLFTPSIRRTVEVLDWGVRVTDRKGWGKPKVTKYKA